VIVIDASALTAFILREEKWSELSSYMYRAVSVDNVVKEVSNAIWKAFYIRKYLSAEDAFSALEVLKMLVGKNLILYQSFNYLAKAFDISIEHGITLYDSVYIALALSEGAQLLTLDEKQANVAKSLGIRVLP